MFLRFLPWLTGIFLFPALTAYGVSQDTLSARRYLEAATACFESGQWQTAQEWAGAAWQWLPDSAHTSASIAIELGNLLGNTSVETHEPDKAGFWFRRSTNWAVQYLNPADTLLSQTWNDLGEYHFRAARYDLALLWHSRALELRHQYPESLQFKTADSYNNLGNAYLLKAAYPEAIAAHETALQLRIQHLGAAHPDVAVSALNLGNCYYYQGQIAAALKWYQRAWDLREKILGLQHPKTVNAGTNIGNCYVAAGAYDQALPYFKNALEVFQKTEGPESLAAADALNNLGTCWSGLFDFQKALPLFQQNLDIRKKTMPAGHPSLAAAAKNLGQCYSSLGDQGRAELLQRQALQIETQTLGPEHPQVAITLDNLGQTLRELGNYDQAQNHYRQALKIRTAIFGNDHPDVANSYTNLGNCLWDQGDYRLAREYYRYAVQILGKIYPAQHPQVVNNLINLSTCEVKLSRYGAAATQLNKVRPYLQSQDQQATVIQWLGWCDFYLGDLDTAADRFQEGLSLFQRDSLSENYSGNTVELALLNGAGQTAWKQYRQTSDTVFLDQALTSFRKGIRLIQNLRNSYQDAASKQILMEYYYPVFEGALAVQFEKAKKENTETPIQEAFQLAEQSKALLLQESWQYAEALSKTPLPDSLQQLEQSIQAQIAYWERRRSESGGSDSTAAQQWLGWQTQYQQFQERIEKRYPALYRYRYQSNALDLKEVQRKLETDQTLLEYFEGDSSVYVFFIQPTSMSGVCLPKDFPLQAWVNSFRRSIQNFPTASTRDLPKVMKVHINTSQLLFERLVRPVETQTTLSKKIIVVPAGILEFLPFESLLQSVPEDSVNFASWPFLIKDHIFSYAFSASLWLHQSSGYQRSRSTLAVAPDFSGRHPMQLQPLRHNKEEATAIAGVTGGDLLADSTATAPHFLRLAPQYDLLHLATHAKSNAIKGDYSFLAFSADADSSTLPVLFARDLYHAHLPVNMVVLSACETGLGEYQRGEGVVSLARAFSLAGAKSVVTTLWSVDDAATARMMQYFYKQLETGRSKDEALHAAKMNMLQEGGSNAFPFYWAACIPLGDMAPMSFGHSWWSIAWPWVIAVLLGSAGLYGFFRRRD